MKKKRAALLNSVIALILCVAMLAGTTFAWFTDKVVSDGNIITSGNLDIEMYWAEDLSGSWNNVEDAGTNRIFDYDNWEPGYTQVRYIKIVNAGNLAFRYALDITPNGEVSELADVIDVYAVIEPTAEIGSRDSLTNPVGTLREAISGDITAKGVLHPAGAAIEDGEYAGEIILGIALKMREDAGNEYQNKSIGDSFGVTLLATQYTYEEDSFGDDYDTDAELPSLGLKEDATGSAAVTVENGATTAETTISTGTDVKATVPAGVAVEDGKTELTLSVSEKENSDSNVTTGSHEELVALDIHVDGVSAGNTTPIIVELGAVLPIGMNWGNVALYHVENGVTHAMTQVGTVAELDTHNQFYYDPATGNLTVAMATFSEVTLVADTENAWNGEFDYTWYDADATELTIANADQLAAFSAIVGGMNDQTQDSFFGKTVKLIADVNLGDKESENDPDLIFYPIGYYNGTGSYEKVSGVSVTSDVNSFEGTFDGNGHTVKNFYQNTWEMFGDYNSGYSGTPNHYKDAMGLFGYVLNGTVKNLTVDNFSSDGEFTPTGVIAAYAVNSTFENIAITNCNPRVYNTGNGGIVGIGGDSSDTKDSKLIFKNITIDNTNKISALWGSWDVACGGLMGMFFGPDDVADASRIVMTNCHVAAQIDVNNDVCGNYQYYWYRYSGMMVGTIDYHKTENGYTVPDTSMITAEDCTVHFGDWNDYYYCELVANSLASYTHDHQFSRLTEVDSVDVTNMTVTVGDVTTAIPTSGRYNYVVVNGEASTENATCYHFVDGKQHSHNDYNGDGVDDYETVNGESVLVEDKQHYYLPFNQLFTGYGWGVKNIPVYNGEDYAFEGITILDREVADSVEKFETKFTGDFLYRVGNQNTVALDSLFAAKDGVTINGSGVYVSIDKVDENSNVSGTFTANTSDWTKGTIQFTGTGVVKVTIQDYNFCTPTVLYLEVIDATNLTSATGTTSGGTFVLLCDVNASNYVYYWNCTLYGNGFTYSLNGAPTNYSSSHGHGVLITQNATLDNIVIVGDIYDEYGAYTNNNDYNAAIDVMGDTVIQNCYISGCAAPVSTRADATIINTTLYGGAVANLLIKGGTVTLEDVTTANYKDGRNAPIGMGIVIHSDASETAKLVLNGTLTQFNFLNEKDTPTDTYAKNLHSTMFGTSLSKYHFGTSPNRRVNTGIVSLTATFNSDDITDNANTGYSGSSVTLSGVDGYVYTQPNTSGSVNNGYNKEKDPHIATTQGTVAPEYSFDYTTKNYVAKTDGSNDYCYEENGKVNISMDEGDTFDWDTSILTLGKGIENYTVTMNGTDYTGKSIAFNTAGDYEVVYTYTDDNNFGIDENGNITTYSKTYTKTVNITVAVVEAATKHAEFTFGSSNTASTTVTVGNNTYVMPNVSATSATIGSTTVSGQTIYYPIVEIVMSDGKTSHTSGWYAYFPVFSGAVTITDYKDNGLGDAETFGSSTTTMPSGLSIVGDPAQLFKYQSSSTAGTSPVVKNNILVYSSPSISANRNEYNTVIQYSYQDNAGATYYYYIGYHAPAQSYSSICVTPDTLVTMADGSKKMIKDVSVGEKVIAWNFYSGKYETVPVSLLQAHDTGNMDVLHLYFEDGTELKVLGEHGVFDADLNTFVFIDKDDVGNYVGHNFIKQDGDGYKTVKLIGYEVTEEYTTAYTILSTDHYNVMLEDMLTVTPAHVGGNFFNPFEIGEGMKYDEEMAKADIEKYGLYTYEDFAHVLTYEQFAALNLGHFKVSVGKGLVTYEGLIYLIETFINGEF